jgi:hypothetical protein
MPDNIGAEMATGELVSEPISRAALFERLVKLEVRSEQQAEGMGVIRSNIHDINNKLTITNAFEARCTALLEGIQATLTKWEPMMATVIAEKAKGEGVRLTWGHMAVIISLLIAGAGSIIGAISLLFKAHSLTP